MSYWRRTSSFQRHAYTANVALLTAGFVLIGYQLTGLSHLLILTGFSMYNVKTPSLNELPSSEQPLRSTVIAAITAAVILVTIVLPAEYAIDPTGDWPRLESHPNG